MGTSIEVDTKWTLDGESGLWTPAAIGAEGEAWWKEPTLTTGRVSAIPDKLKAHHWTQTDPLYRPVPDGGGILFTAANKERLTLSGAALITGLAAAHLFLVIQLAADPTVGSNDGLWHWGSTSTRFPFSGDGVIYDNFGTDTRKVAGNPATNMASAKVCYEVFSGAGDWQAWVNGTPVSPSQANTVAWPAITQTLGTDATFAYCLNGHWYEMIICSAKQTGAKLANVKSYITREHGIVFA